MDPVAAVIGIGLFGAICAFNSKRLHDLLSRGWKSSRLGCLEEREAVFALAVLFELMGRDADAVRVYLKVFLFLKAALFRSLRAAGKSLLRRPAPLAGIEGGIG